jgi:hypothetical protein
VKSGGERMAVGPGGAVLIPPGVRHRAAGRMTILNVEFCIYYIARLSLLCRARHRALLFASHQGGRGRNDDRATGLKLILTPRILRLGPRMAGFHQTEHPRGHVDEFGVERAQLPCRMSPCSIKR